MRFAANCCRISAVELLLLGVYLLSTRTALWFYSTVACTQVKFRHERFSADNKFVFSLIFYCKGYYIIFGQACILHVTMCTNIKKTLANAFIPQKKQIFCLSRINESGCLKTDSITITNTVFSSSFLFFLFEIVLLLLFFAVFVFLFLFLEK